MVLVVVFLQLDRLVQALTPFADDWEPGLARTTRTLSGIALVGGLVLIMVISFTTLTLAIGSPVYDKLSESVEREFGEVPELVEPAKVGVVRAVRQSAALIATSALGAIAAVRLRIRARDRADPGAGRVGHLRRLDGGDRTGRLVLRAPRSGQADRPPSRAAPPPDAGAGSGRADCFLLLAIPFVGVLIFPVATAAGTLLARQLLGESTVVPVRPSGLANQRIDSAISSARVFPMSPSSRIVTGIVPARRSHTRHGAAILACAVRCWPSRST